MRLSTFAAEPRRVTLAGVPVLAGKLRVRDLAYLEAWMADCIPRPEGDDDLPGGWPPTFDTEAGLSLLASGEGIAHLVFASLRQTVGSMTIEQAREIVLSVEPDEFGPFYAAIFPEGDGGDEPSPGRGPSRTNWHSRINSMAHVYGYTPGQILDLPLDQFFALGRDPRPDRPAPRWATPITKPEDLDRLWADRQAARNAAVDHPGT